MKVLVCGDRDWTNKEAIRRELSKFPPGTVVVHGDCRGADRLAGEVAEELGFRVIPVPADWDTYGDAAGPIRNAKMLREHPDIERVLAFHPNLKKSKGTKNMWHQAIGAGLDPELFKE
jgi:hypothetical protein